MPQGHEAIDAEAGRYVVDGEFHLVGSEDRIPAQRVRDVVRPMGARRYLKRPWGKRNVVRNDDSSSSAS